METKLIITPRTKISQLIEAYPQLEDVLINYVPAFKKLKNPALRKTIADVITLQQAASIGNAKVEELVNRMRQAVGQDDISIETEMGYATGKPEWFNEEKIVKELDVREMLAAGEHPVNLVVSEVNNLGSNEIYKVIAPFLPAPMIDKITGLGFRHWVVNSPDNLFVIYFFKE